MKRNEEDVDIMLDAQDRALEEVAMGDALKLRCPFIAEVDPRGDLTGRRAKCDPDCALFARARVGGQFFAGCSKRLVAILLADRARAELPF